MTGDLLIPPWAQRLRDREVGSGFDEEMEASDSAARYIEHHDEPGVPLIATDRRTVHEVAAEVLDVTEWLS